MVNGTPRRTRNGLTVVGLRRSFLPLEDIEDGLVVDAEAGTKLGTPFKDLVYFLAVELSSLFEDDVKVDRDAVRAGGSSRSAVDVEGLEMSRYNPCASFCNTPPPEFAKICLCPNGAYS